MLLGCLLSCLFSRSLSAIDIFLLASEPNSFSKLFDLTELVEHLEVSLWIDSFLSFGVAGGVCKAFGMSRDGASDTLRFNRERLGVVAIVVADSPYDTTGLLNLGT